MGLSDCCSRAIPLLSHFFPLTVLPGLGLEQHLASRCLLISVLAVHICRLLNTPW